MNNLVNIVIFIVALSSIKAENNETSEVDVNEKSVVLSRRKRFLVFPEGSSFQLVFCTTFPTVFQISDIFIYGYTAALAWELPQDPYSPFNHRADPLHRRMDTKMIYYTDEDGKIIDKKPYHRKPIVNPAFAKRSVEKEKETFIDRQQMHATENRRAYLNEWIGRRTVEFHRNSRTELYQKIETLLHGLGVNGNNCVLKTLCLVGQAETKEQGTFFQEIMRATFTLPNTSDTHQNEYDEALAAKGSCDDLYPECDEPLLTPDSPTFAY